MGLFEKMFARGQKQAGMIEVPEQYMQEMSPGLPGPQGVDPYGGMDPNMLNNPLFSNYREQAEMTGIANITVDNSEIIEDFAAQLRGYKIKHEIDPLTGKIVPRKMKLGKPFCNDEGVNELVGVLAMMMSKSWMLTNIPKRDRGFIDRLMLINGIELSEKMVKNVERWQMDRTRMSSISTQIISTAFGNIMRGFEDGERTKIYPTQKNVNMTSNLPHMNPAPKRSLFET